MKSDQPFPNLRNIALPTSDEIVPFSSIKYSVPEEEPENINIQSNEDVNPDEEMNELPDPGSDIKIPVDQKIFDDVLQEEVAKMEAKNGNKSSKISNVMGTSEKFSVLGSKKSESDVGEDANMLYGLETPEVGLLLRTQYKTSIYEYKTHFSHCLEAFGDRLEKENIEALDDEGLKLLYQEIRIVVGSRNSAQLIPTAVNMISIIPEKFGHLFGLDLEGFTNNIKLSTSLKENIQELSIEYKKYIYVHPLYRFGLNYVQLLAYTHDENQMKKQLLEKLSTAVNQSALEEFKDL